MFLIIVASLADTGHMETALPSWTIAARPIAKGDGDMLLRVTSFPPMSATRVSENTRFLRSAAFAIQVQMAGLGATSPSRGSLQHTETEDLPRL